MSTSRVFMSFAAVMGSVFLFLGCGDDSALGTGSGGHVTTVAYRARFTDWKKNGVPIEGMRVEVVGRADLPSELTDASGVVTIPGLTPGDVVVVRWTKSGFQCGQRTMRVGAVDLDERDELVLSDAWIDDYEAGLPYVVDQEKSFIELAVRSSALPDSYLTGVRVVSTPMTGDVCYYAHEGPDGCGDAALEGQLTVHNLPEGRVELRFEGENGPLTCTTDNPETDWTLGAIAIDGSADTFELETGAGCESFVRVYCEPT